MEGMGTYAKVDATFKMHNGGTCYFRTATDCDSVIGITNVRFIWGDEAGLYPLYFHENIQARSAFKQAPIMYTTSPYSLNWLYKDYIRPFHRGKLDDNVLVVQARSDENPYFPREMFEQKKRTMDQRRFNMIFGGEFHKIEGLVYNCFDDETHVVDKFLLPNGTKFIAGVDWGYTNPCCILVLAITPNEGVYLVHEFYKTQQRIGQMVDMAVRLRDLYGIEIFHCDPSSPANIIEFNKAGCTAVAANNDIRSGVDYVYEKIKEGKFHVFRDAAPNFVDEISTYHYPEDKNITPDKDVKDSLPVKQDDHSMDAFRYPMFSLKSADIMRKKRPVDHGGVDTRVAFSHNDYNLEKLMKRLDRDEYDV
jgi:PBSX family phage terminase large subunit